MIKNWFVNLWGSSPSSRIGVGARVNHKKFGSGTVIGGSLHVRYDDSSHDNHLSGNAWTHNLSNNEIEML